ncbi:hypothetical protein Pcinc_038770 [Petrolisthes cinctipes]|uniref:Ionotropic glutamate receptor L-glutamate and glycine-binding domain-containing protein n=1 Tax=Petrolisthes cinctipes TaxID=88211 RepID=A0AAE1EMP1_PETCI|nr:hypothetical protein Pcinc_038770 [Petrolisthes cinctipes]
MRVYPALTSLILFVVKFASSSQPSLLADKVNEKVDNTRAQEFFTLADILVVYHTPKCLRVIILGEDMKNVPLTLDAGYSQPTPADVLMENPLYNSTTQAFELNARIILQAHLINQTQRVLTYINENPGRVTSFSCVTYIVTRPFDSRLLPVLTDSSSSSKQLTRYFLIQTQNITEANEVLLDQRLGEEMNVVAVFQRGPTLDKGLWVREKRFTDTSSHLQQGSSYRGSRGSNNSNWEGDKYTAAFTNKQHMNDNNGGSSWFVYIRQLMHPSGSPQVLHVNTWSNTEGGHHLTKKADLFPEQMGNFYGKKLKGSMLDFKPFINYEKVEGSRVVVPKPSLDVMILNVIADKLNFTFDLVMPEDGQWGYLREDGHWVGVVGDVEFRRANFSLCLSLTLERLESVEFTRSYFRDPLTFLAAKSRPGDPWRKLLTPFSPEVWVSTLISVAGGVVLYTCLTRIQHILAFSLYPPTSTTTTPSNHITTPSTPTNHITNHTITTPTITTKPSNHTPTNTITTNTPFTTPSADLTHLVSGALTYILGSFFGQALIHLPRLSAGKVFLGFWLIHGLLVTTYYKTSLTGTLAVPFASPTIDTLQQLLDSDLKLAMRFEKGSDYQMFATSNVTTYKHMFRNTEFLLQSEIYRGVVSGEYAYVYFKSSVSFRVATQYTNVHGKTNLHVASENFFPSGYSWAFPKGSPYRLPFDEVMRRCLQAGLVDKWLNELYSYYLKERLQQRTPQQRRREEQAAMEEKDDGLVVLNLRHLQGPFFIWFLGNGGGVLVLLLEVMTARPGPSHTTS